MVIWRAVVGSAGSARSFPTRLGRCATASATTGSTETDSRALRQPTQTRRAPWRMPAPPSPARAPSAVSSAILRRHRLFGRLGGLSLGGHDRPPRGFLGRKEVVV